MTIYKWQFVPRFRRNAFGWRSDTPIQRIKEAVAEIKLAAKKEPEIAAEGAVIFLEKLSPAIDGVDSSSGSIGSAVNRAIAGARITVGDSGVYKHGGVVPTAIKGALDISRARAELGYAPQYDIQTGIEATIAATRLALGL